jgi:C-terminal processing protease CtpA/Prc
MNLLYLEVSIISNKTTALLLEEVNEAIQSACKIDGIILDLRGNS